jgi:hypothetical protein
MASATAAAPAASKVEDKGPPSAPGGFRRVSAVDDAPWFEYQEGNLCHGHVEGRFVMQTDPPRGYYQINLKTGCKVRVGKGDEAKVVDAKQGDVINLGETFRTETLREKVAAPMEAGGDYDVWMLVGKKRKLTGGRTMWTADVQTKENKAPTRKVEPIKDATTVGDEDAPF